MIRARGLALLLLLPACGSEAPQPDRVDQELPRAGRFGTLRDLVLFERSDTAGGPYFLDRFEATRDDWQAYLQARGLKPPPLSGPGALPATGMNLAEARAFATWRFCRLPRRDEWEFAAQRGNPYPWGQASDPARANTAELGLGALTPVGTFESGRRVNGPYDLVGNAAEWTESVSVDWVLPQPPDGPTAGPELDQARSYVLRSPALSTWLPPGGVMPWLWIAEALGPKREQAGSSGFASKPDLVLAQWYVSRSPALSTWLPPGGMMPWPWVVEALGLRREVVGGDCRSTMRQEDLVRPQFPTDASSVLGLRLCADPPGLCAALAASSEAPSGLDAAVLRRFLRREGNAEALAPAWQRVRDHLRARGTAPGPVAAILDAELAR